MTYSQIGSKSTSITVSGTYSLQGSQLTINNPMTGRRGINTIVVSDPDHFSVYDSDHNWFFDATRS
jgi:uncharacterized protein with von Willebrand factor type A (vWA) domain